MSVYARCIFNGTFEVRVMGGDGVREKIVSGLVLEQGGWWG